MTPEYGDEELTGQQSERVSEQSEGILPQDREDSPERVMEERDLEDRELEYLNPEDNEAHAPGRVCARCGAVITARQDVRLQADNRWVHEECPWTSASCRKRAQDEQARGDIDLSSPASTS